MAPENILFSRARPGVTPTSKKIRGFLGLSGELRNKIYRYYFQEGFRCEVAAKGSDFCSNRTRRERGCPNILRMSRKLGNYKRVDGIQTNWSNSLCALILICRQVHHEAIIFLYQKTTFIFDAPKRITNFVEAVPGKNLANFTRVEMHYSTYGHPKSSNDQIWKEKHHASWSRAYKVAAKSLINLQVLKITVLINDSPLVFDLHEEWVQPLLHFRRLNQKRKSSANVGGSTEGLQVGPLKKTEVRLHSRWTGSIFRGISQHDALCSASSDLHRIFGRAISNAILGAGEEEAMAEFKEAWGGKYSRWKHHLQFSRTGW